MEELLEKVLPLTHPDVGFIKLTFENISGLNNRLNSDILTRLSKLCTNLVELTIVFTIENVTRECRDSFFELFYKILSEVKIAKTKTWAKIIMKGLSKSTEQANSLLESIMELPMISMKHFFFFENASFSKRRVQFNNFFMWLRKLPELEILGVSESTLEVKQATNIITYLGMRNVGHSFRDDKALITSDCWTCKTIMTVIDSEIVKALGINIY